MTKKIYLFILVALLSLSYQATAADYYIPTHYKGIFIGQPTSARAAAMGLTTITLGGIENMVYNPASIGLENNNINLYFNHAIGEQVWVGSKYNFIGASYRIIPKLVLGLSMQHWGLKDSPWTVIIGSFEENVEKRSQIMYTLGGAYEVIPNLQVGFSGNYLVDKAVGSTVTNSEFIASLGAVYDKDVNWIKLDNLENQKIRFAGSIVNLFMKNEIEQRYEEYLHYRDLPIRLTLGTSYHASLPFDLNFLKNINFFKEVPKEVDLSLHLQYGDLLKGKDKGPFQDNDHKMNTSLGVGAEALFMKRVAFRLGYYFEKRPEGFEDDGSFWATTNKKGLTFGYGVKIPVNELTDDKIPFDVDVDIVTFKVLNELNTENYTHPEYFRNNNFLFAFGLKLRWTGN